jgi:hypothetical protein
MDVAWTLTPDRDGVQVAIWHQFAPSWPLVPDALVTYVIGDFFVESIAMKTLQRIKELAEEQHIVRNGRTSPTPMPADVLVSQ